MNYFVSEYATKSPLCIRDLLNAHFPLPRENAFSKGETSVTFTRCRICLYRSRPSADVASVGALEQDLTEHGFHFRKHRSRASGDRRCGRQGQLRLRDKF